MQEQACTQRSVELTSKDLPLSCPMQGMQVWDAHPRVYLPLEESGSVVCPYCSTKYTLKDFNPDAT
jgi:uncharacterized Zn-finger protein